MKTVKPNEVGSAIVVGASLSGLMAGIALAREGINVLILDKINTTPREGAGLQVDGGAFEMSKTARLLRKLASGGKRSIQLWSNIERNLRTEALNQSNIEIRYNTRIEAVDQDEDIAWVITDSKEQLSADIIIGADGHRSLVRGFVAPDKPDATFGGYMVWIAAIEEDQIPEEHRPLPGASGVQMLQGINGFLFGSIIDQNNKKGVRRIGCAWYDNTRTDLLYELGCVRDNVVHHSINGEDIPEETLVQLANDARAVWPEPFLSATLHAIDTRDLTGIPIKEYVPERLVNGRIALIGDAAHVPAPITASGFNESLQDAAELGKHVSKGIIGDDAYKALQKYETNRLNTVRQMVMSGQSFGRSFGQW